MKTNIIITLVTIIIIATLTPITVHADWDTRSEIAIDEDCDPTEYKTTFEYKEDSYKDLEEYAAYAVEMEVEAAKLEVTKNNYASQAKSVYESEYNKVAKKSIGKKILNWIKGD